MFTYADIVSIQPLRARATIPCRLEDPAIAPDDACISSMWAEELKAVAFAIAQAEGRQPRGLGRIARILGRATPYTVRPELCNHAKPLLHKREQEGIFCGA